MSGISVCHEQVEFLIQIFTYLNVLFYYYKFESNSKSSSGEKNFLLNKMC